MAQGTQLVINNPHLAPFVVDGKLSGRLLGTGSYGSVEEVPTIKP